MRKKDEGVRVLLIHAPSMKAISELSHGIIAKRNLPERRIACCKLANTDSGGDRELGNGGKGEKKLTESKQNANTELGNRNESNRKLSNRDNALSHTQLSSGIPSVGYMDQRIAQKRGLGFPVNAGAVPNGPSGKWGAALGTGPGHFAYIVLTLSTSSQYHDLVVSFRMMSMLNGI